MCATIAPARTAMTKEPLLVNQSSPQPSYLPPEAPLPTSGMAIASARRHRGILGFTIRADRRQHHCDLYGLRARKETRSTPRASGGSRGNPLDARRGRQGPRIATAGIVMGYIQLGIAVGRGSFGRPSPILTPRGVRVVGVCCLLAYLVFALGILGSVVSWGHSQLLGLGFVF